MLSAFAPLNILGELSLAEKGVSSVKVILTGFLVVFAMLIFLIIIVKIYSLLVGKAQRSGLVIGRKKKFKKPKKTEKTEETQKSAAAGVVVFGRDSHEPESDEIPEEVIAVISAAVATMYGGSEKVKIKSVKRSRAKRSAWANAGVIENTRPF